MVKIEQVARPFFGREDVLSWVEDWLQKCSGRCIILGIDGMGGIGKTAILQKLDTIHKYSILVDCSKHDMMSLLNTISIKARHVGFKTPRFDHLRDIRLWFLEGIQPAKSASKGWVKDLVAWIPEINKMVKIASAIITSGKKIHQLIRKYCGSIEQWFKDILGESYGTKLLELLVNNPEQTLNLFIEALSADLKTSPTSEDFPLLILLDSFEYVDSKNYDETSYPDYDIKLNQTEKWHIFLSKLQGAVGIVSGRSLPFLPKTLSIQRYDKEITELDEDSCRMLLEKRGITDTQLIDNIIHISHRNPFVISTICDIADRGELQIEEVMHLKSEALIEVRERTWNLLFSKAKEIWKFISYASLIPFFDYQILQTLSSDITEVLWKNLLNFSFVQYDEPYWNLHDLARDFAIAELGDDIGSYVAEIRNNLLDAFNRTQKPVFLGILLSATNHISEKGALHQTEYVIHMLKDSQRRAELISILEMYEPVSVFGQGFVHYHLGMCYQDMNRLGDARFAFLESVKYLEEVENPKDTENRTLLVAVNEMLGITYLRMGDNKLSEVHYTTALRIVEELWKEFPDSFTKTLARTLGNFGAFYIETARMSQGEDLLLRASKISASLSIQEVDDLGIRILILNSLGNLYKDTNRLVEAEKTYKQAIEDAEKNSNLLTDEVIDTLCRINSNLGLLYFKTDELEKSRYCYNKSLDLLSELKKSRPDLCRYFLPDLITNIGLLEAIEIGYDQAMPRYDEALSLYRELAKENPGFYMKDIAMVQFNRGVAFREIGKMTDAISAFKESRDIYSQLKKVEPDLYIAKLANVYSHLAASYVFAKKLEESEETIIESMKLYKKLDPESLQLHIGDYAFALNHKGIVEYRLGLYAKALKSYGESLEIFDNLTKINPSGYNQFKGMVLSNIAAIFVDRGDGAKAEEYSLLALEIFSQFIGNRPLLFLSYGFKVIDNLNSIYLKTMGLPSEDARARLTTHLERLVGKEMTMGILATLYKE